MLDNEWMTFLELEISIKILYVCLSTLCVFKKVKELKLRGVVLVKTAALRSPALTHKNSKEHIVSLLRILTHCRYFRNSRVY